MVSLLLISLNVLKVKVPSDTFQLENIMEWEELQEALYDAYIEQEKYDEKGFELDDLNDPYTADQFDDEFDNGEENNDKIKKKTVTFVALDILRLIKVFQAPNITNVQQ